MTALISFDHVNFSYGQVPVLQGINFSIQEDEFFGLIGPNAGGKSTLLKLMIGTLTPDSGKISVLGATPQQARIRLGYVPQYPSFSRDFPISVEDVVLTGRIGIARTIGGYSKKDKSRAHEILQVLGIDSIASQSINTLSGGQTQRMLIARAMVSDPEVLILDEPTANIDIQAEENIFALLKKFKEHMTIIVVSHDVGFISGYVDRVGCLNRTLVCHTTKDISGKTIEELYGTPVKMIHHHHEVDVHGSH